MRKPEEINRAVRQQVQELLEAARIEETRLWLKIDQYNNIKVDVEGVLGEYKQIARQWSKYAEESELFRLFNKSVQRMQKEVNAANAFNKKNAKAIAAGSIKEKVPTMSFKDVVAMRSRLLREIRLNASKLTGDVKKATTEVEQWLFNKLEDLGQAGNENAWFSARQFSNELNEKFTRGRLGDVFFGVAEGGRPKTPHSETLGKFLRNASEEDLAQFANMAGGEEAMQANVRQWLKQSYEASASKGQWMRNYRQALKEFPEVADDIAEFDAAVTRQATLTKRNVAIAKAENAEAARMLLNDDPQIFARRIMASANPRRSLYQAEKLVRKDPAAKMALRESIWEEIQNLVRKTDLNAPGIGAADQAWYLSPEKLSKILRTPKNKALLDAIYTADELKQITELVNYARRISISGKATVAPGTQVETAQNMYAVMTLPQILGRAYNVQRGVVSKTFVFTEAAARFATRFLADHSATAQEELLRQAVYDPEIARTLLMKITPKTMPTIIKRMHAHLNALGIESRVVEEDAQAEQQSPPAAAFQGQ